ncbi:hypothetical protein BH23VER1_BH23VER1_09980 [soil metagenome]
MPVDAAAAGQTVRAEVDGQTITIEAEGVGLLTLRLSDALLDLDQPVVAIVNGKETFSGKVERQLTAVWDSLQERADPKLVATAVVDLKF